MTQPITPNKDQKRDWVDTGCSLFTVPLLLFFFALILYIAVTFFSFLPLWAAILIGIPIAIVGVLLLCIGETTAFELAVKCVIYIVLIAGIFMPVANKAKSNAQRQRMKMEQKAKTQLK